MDVPEVRFAITEDDVRIAYMDFGSGPPMIVSDFFMSHLELTWSYEAAARVFRRLASNVRVITFDHRGEGLSDGFVQQPTLEDRAFDIKALMDATEVPRANVVGVDMGGQVAVAFAARFPDLVDKLVLLNAKVGRSEWAQARALELNPGYVDHGRDIGSVESRMAQADGRGADISLDDGRLFYSPSLANHPDVMERGRDHLAAERAIGTRDAWKRQAESMMYAEITGLAPLVQAPTQIVHAKGHRMFHIGEAHVLNELIPNSTLIVYEGEDQEFYFADNWREVVDYALRFVTGSDVEDPVERRFATVLFTDIVDSTKASLVAGDREWRELLDQHDRTAESVVRRRGGRLVKNTGDGLLATFTSPSTAIDAALDLRDELGASNIDIRAGLHAGEIEQRGNDVSGAVVNLAARVEQAAGAGKIYVSKSLRDMLLGSAHTFESAGEHSLKGFDDRFQLFAVVANSGQAQ